MEDVAKIMARGLIALPSEIRKKVGLKEGDMVKVEVRGEEIVIKKEKRVFDLKGALGGSDLTQKTFAQILAEELKKEGKKL